MGFDCLPLQRPPVSGQFVAGLDQPQGSPQAETLFHVLVGQAWDSRNWSSLADLQALSSAKPFFRSTFRSPGGLVEERTGQPDHNKTGRAGSKIKTV